MVKNLKPRLKHNSKPFLIVLGKMDFLFDFSIFRNLDFSIFSKLLWSLQKKKLICTTNFGQKSIFMINFGNLPVGRSGSYFTVLKTHMGLQNCKVWGRSARGKCIKISETLNFPKSGGGPVPGGSRF